MTKAQIYVTVVVQIKGDIDILPYEKYLQKNGFEKVEKFAYLGKSSSPVMNIKAFIFSVFKKAFELGGVQRAKLIYQIGENTLEAHEYKKGEFVKEIKI